MNRSYRTPAPGPAPRPLLARTLPLVALSLLAATLAATAHPRRPDPVAAGNLVDVQVEVDGRAAPLYRAPGRYDRHYFQAFRGRNYSLVLRNNTGRRVGVVIAVDGLNVVNGERSRLSGTEPMYVLDPWERAEIQGWRTSLREVRRFVFVDEERSYAERTGQANGDMGWIRVLAFREQDAPWLGQDLRPKAEPFGGDAGSEAGRERSAGRNAPAPLPPASAEAPSELKAEGQGSARDESNPGTGWGREAHDPVQRTWFTAEHHATDHLVFRYEYASGLRALGIDLRPHRDRLREREDGLLGFARPPRD